MAVMLTVTLPVAVPLHAGATWAMLSVGLAHLAQAAVPMRAGQAAAPLMPRTWMLSTVPGGTAVAVWVKLPLAGTQPVPLRLIS